jgi:methylase of polypeptide subunit release factors
MNDKGVVLFEIGYDQGKAILDLCEKYLNKYTARCLKDISGNDRIVIIELL